LARSLKGGSSCILSALARCNRTTSDSGTRERQSRKVALETPKNLGVILVSVTAALPLNDVRERASSEGSEGFSYYHPYRALRGSHTADSW
jgi:hypothetical protein